MQTLVAIALSGDQDKPSWLFTSWRRISLFSIGPTVNVICRGLTMPDDGRDLSFIEVELMHRLNAVKA